jgi:alpha-D-xyloside xylohydrolase
VWYNFWTGDTLIGGQTISSAAPIDTLPLFVKAGSIIPVGPFVQYAAEKPANPSELRIYPGADGSFTLYEDENDNTIMKKVSSPLFLFPGTMHNDSCLLKSGKAPFQGC